MKIKNILITLVASFLAIGCGGGGGGASDPLNFNQEPKSVVKVDKLATIDKSNYEKVIMLALDDSMINLLEENDVFASSDIGNNQRRAKVIDGSSDACFSGKAEYDDVNYVVRFTNCDQDDKVINGLVKYNDNPDYATSQQIKNFSIKFLYDSTLKEFYIQEGYISGNSFKLTGYIKTKDETIKFKDLEVKEVRNSFTENGYLSSKKYLNGDWIKLKTTKTVIVDSECYKSGEYVISGANNSQLKINFDNCKIKTTINGISKTYNSIDELELLMDNPGKEETITKSKLYEITDTNKSLNRAFYSALIGTSNISNSSVDFIKKLKELKEMHCDSGSVQYNGNIATYKECVYDGYTFTGKSKIKRISDYSDIEFEAYVKNLHITKDDSKIYFKNLHLKYYERDRYKIEESGYISSGSDKISFLNLKYNYDPIEDGISINGSFSSSICLNSDWIDIKTDKNLDSIEYVDKGYLEVTLKQHKASVDIQQDTVYINLDDQEVNRYGFEYDELFIDAIKAACEN